MRSTRRSWTTSPGSTRGPSRSARAAGTRYSSAKKALLVPLPGKPYEMIARKAATVNFNYHVAFDGGWYSVPFSYVRREVEVCATKSAVWVVCDGERIAMHKRLHGPKGPYSTNPDHMPDAHRDFAESGTGIASADGQRKSAPLAPAPSGRSSRRGRSSSSPTDPAGR